MAYPPKNQVEYANDILHAVTYAGQQWTAQWQQSVAHAISTAHTVVDTTSQDEAIIRAGHRTLNIVQRTLGTALYKHDPDFDRVAFAKACQVWKDSSPRYHPELKDQTDDS